MGAGAASNLNVFKAASRLEKTKNLKLETASNAALGEKTFKVSRASRRAFKMFRAIRFSSICVRYGISSPLKIARGENATRRTGDTRVAGNAC